MFAVFAVLSAFFRIEMVLIEYPESYSILRLAPASQIPVWVRPGRFISVTRTQEELSVICLESCVPRSQSAEHGWTLIGCQGPLAFSEVGILARLTTHLADAKIPLLAVSTHETDYILTRSPDKARSQLKKAGYEVIRASSSAINV